MPQIDLQIDGKTVPTWVCGRGLHACYACGKLSGWQCDAFVAPPSKRRCNRHICEQHRTPLTTNKDACPEHAAVCLAALERARVAV